MMNLRNTLTTSVAAIALMAGSSAQAGDYYFSVFGGISTFDDEIPFEASTSNSAFLGSAYVSRVTLAGGPIPPFSFSTTLLYLTGFTTPTGTVPLFSAVPFSTVRNLGYYKVIGSRFDAFSQVQDSDFRWEDDFDSGFVIGAALGQDFGSNWRGELELAYRRADVSGGGNFSRRIDGTLYQEISFPYATNYIYVGYNAGNGGLYTTGGFASGTNLAVGPYTIGGTLTGLPVSTGSATTFVKAATIPGYGPIPYKTIAFPVNGTTAGNFSSDGDVQVWSLMANLWYDFDFMGLNPDGVRTFFGGGVGVAQLDLEYNASMGTYFGGTIGYGLDDSGMGFAYQLGAGIGFDMGNGMMLSAQYRWFGTSDIDVGATDLRVESHNALIGLSVPFGN